MWSHFDPASPKGRGLVITVCSVLTWTYRVERRELGNPKSTRKEWFQPWPLWPHLPVLLLAAMETFCETVQFYLRHLEDSLYPVMTEDQFAVKLFPMYRYFVTVWLRHQDLEVRLGVLRGLCILWVTLPRRCCRTSGFSSQSSRDPRAL